MALSGPRMAADATCLSWAPPVHLQWLEGARQPLRYLWDDTRASADFRHDAQDLLEAMAPASHRAHLALALGLYEWVVWRFHGLHRDPVPLQLLEAGWCAAVDPRCLGFFVLPRDAWHGPVRGPLWCAMTWLQAALQDGPHRPEEVDDGVDYLYRLAMHVLPNTAPLQDWLAWLVPRLVRQSPDLVEDLYADLFDARLGAGFGALVDRPQLWPETASVQDGPSRWLPHLVAQAGSQPHNPLLRTPWPDWLTRADWPAWVQTTSPAEALPP